jgi:hypothetical protein
MFCITETSVVWFTQSESAVLIRMEDRMNNIVYVVGLVVVVGAIVAFVF